MESAKNVARVFEYLGLYAEGTPIEKTRLNKLLYFAQGHALSELGHGLFTNEIDAWDHGPVVAVVFSHFDRIVEHTMRDGISDIQMSPEEMDVIMDVWDQYRGYSASELVKLTHQEGTPWREVYRPGIRNAHIPAELIREYFARPENALKHQGPDLNCIPVVDALSAEDYDPDEDSVWEAALNAAE